MASNRLKVLFLLLEVLTFATLETYGQNASDLNEDFKGRLLSPRLDHNGWKPLGQGDPLKNDPTFDYSPPALGRVRYWAENNKTKEAAGSKNKTDILLLGVPIKQDNAKKEQKYVSIRRSYYGGHLPTRLMPPPMQTIAPHKVKPATTETRYHTTHYPITKNYYITSSSSPYRTKLPYDSKYDESYKYVSVTKPEKKHSISYATPNDFIGMTSSRKPWVHELLQKELIKPKQPRPNFSKPVPSTPMQVIFEPNYPSTYISTTTTPFFTHSTTTTPAPITTSTHKPVYPSYQPQSIVKPIVYPTVAPLEVTSRSPLSHTNGHLEVSMYQIIEGHSKVKTYGQSDESSTHQPKIVPISPRNEAVVRHVTSPEDLQVTFQVKHLHSKQSPPTTTDATTVKSHMNAKPQEYKRLTTQPIQSPTPSPTLEPAKHKSGMEGLLSLLDSPLGNFFIDEPTGDDEGALFSGSALDSEPTIFVTTTASYPPTALELGSPRNARQIFDYDQLPESRLKDSMVPDFDDDTDNSSKMWLRSSGTQIEAGKQNR